MKIFRILLVLFAVFALAPSCVKKAPPKKTVATPAPAPAPVVAPFSFEFTGFQYKSSALNDIQSGLNSRKTELKAKLAELPETVRVVVRGHADAKGPEAPEGRKPGNITLSERRAKTVATWLVKEMGLPESMILIQAKGSSTPKNSRDPYAAENRRVEVLFNP